MIAATAWALLLAGPQDQERARELEKQQWLQERIVEPEIEGETFLDYGVWIRPQYFEWQDGAGQDRSQGSLDVRPWLDARTGPHTFFVRLVASREEWGRGDSPDGDDEDSDVDADVAFWQIDVGRETDQGAIAPLGFLRAGRIYTSIGSGLVYNGRGDGILSSWNLGAVRATGLAAMTPKDTEDLDQSRPNPDETRRLFFGALVEGAWSSTTVPYAFAVIERDRNEESPDDPVQDFDWDAEYWGLGVRGVLGARVRYLVEAIYGTGERFPGAPFTPAEPIRAWAGAAEAAWQAGGPLDWRIEGAFYIGSGDEDRTLALNTILGNTPGTDDEAFAAFGFVSAGLTLNPVISNIRVIKAAAYARPVRPEGLFDASELEVGLELFHYAKVTEGAFSDPFFDLSRRGVGWEADLIVNWTVLSDLSVTLRAGRFEPGSAALVDDPRTFFLVSAVWSY